MCIRDSCTHRGELTHTRLIGSPLRLRQIMLNLFSNAIKYNKPGGTIDTYAGEAVSYTHLVRTSYGILSSIVGICCNILLFTAKLLIGAGMNFL